ncbi:MAG: aldolase/citrate lyase family protein [Chloroflexi bacterium]|nr:aldolase/citrate lyase family protein [Chloroflexota bacterium]
MAERLNNVIQLIESDKPAFGPFLPAGSIPDATWIASSDYDFVVYELEHNAFNLSDLRLSLQFMLDRRQILESGSLAPRVTPMVRIPVNGREQSQWIVKQVLDIGVYGIVFPMINTPEDAVAALQAARYIQAADAPDQEPVGRRGHAPGNVLRYWGLDQPEYFDRADVWPLDPNGEILACLQCETIEGVNNLPAILDAVPNPGLILISESDLSVSMGLKGAPGPQVDEAVQRAREICQERGVYYGSPQVDMANVEQRINEGFSFLMPGAARVSEALNRGRELAGR